MPVFIKKGWELNTSEQLVLRVRPYGSCMSDYTIEYREVLTGFWSILNFLIPWQYLYRTYHVGLLSEKPDKEFPVLYSNFDCAVRDAERYKKDPGLLKNFIRQEEAEWSRIYEQYKSYQEWRKKEKVI